MKQEIRVLAKFPLKNEVEFKVNGAVYYYRLPLSVSLATVSNHKLNKILADRAKVLVK